MALSSEPAYNSTNLSANTAGTAIKAAEGVLHTVVLNKLGASANVLTLYDNPSAASGTVLATIDTTLTGNVCRVYDLRFGTGLFAVLATGTACDVTLTWA